MLYGYAIEPNAGLWYLGGASLCFLAGFGFLEAAGDRWWPFGGGVYFLHCIKRVPGMRLITPQWKRSGAKSKSLAPVPQRVCDDEQVVARRRDSGGA